MLSRCPHITADSRAWLLPKSYVFILPGLFNTMGIFQEMFVSL